MKVKRGNKVQVDYVLKVDNKIKETSLKDIANANNLNFTQPLEFEVGSGEVIYGLSNGIKGMKEGDSKELVIPPVEGYGFYNEDFVRKFPRSVIEKQDVDLYPGARLVIKSPKGLMTATVSELDTEDVTFDLNHDLCNKTLNFQIILKKIIK